MISPIESLGTIQKLWRFSLSEPRFIKATEAIAFNKKAVGQTHENYALLSKGALQNAISRPINRYKYTGTSDVCTLCASLIFGISKAHAFEQGNKRTAFFAGLFFIELNGFGYHGTTNGTKLAIEIIKLCENSVSEAELEDFLKSGFIYRMDSKSIIANR